MMRNIVGQAVSGEDFFKRPSIVKKIKRSFENGNHIYLSAPRRVGKTSIMNHLREVEWEGWNFVYEITESVGSTEEFYKILSKKLLESDAISKVKKASNKFEHVVQKLVNHIHITVNIPFVQIETQGTEAVKFTTEFERLLEELDLGEEKLVFLIDEFPKTIENIMERQSHSEALRFLQVFRDLIHNPKIQGKVQFLLTGSIGLPPIVKKLGGLYLITMLNVIDVPPLDLENARVLLEKLLTHQKVSFEDESISFMLEKLDWLIPFHVQLAAQELIDVYESKEKSIDIPLAEQAFEQILHHRNSIYFEIYRERLTKNLSIPDYKFADGVLKIIADQGSIEKLVLNDLAFKYDVNDTWQVIIESLMYDGFINNHLDSTQYRFNSTILKLWWQKYVC